MKQKSKIPSDALALLSDIAKIRQVVLENAPQVLPLLAPALVKAERRIYHIWNC